MRNQVYRVKAMGQMAGGTSYSGGKDMVEIGRKPILKFAKPLS